MTADLGNRLLERIFHEHSLGNLAVPSLPEVVLRVQRALEAPNADSTAIAQVAQADSALASRLIRIANSPLYHGSTPVFDCERAITRIGLKKLRNLVTSMALREIFQAKSPLIAGRLKDIWHTSVEVAALAAILARIQFRLDVDRALLAGLVHNIGMLPILRYADEFPELADHAALDAVSDKMAVELGVFVLRSWRFDSELAAIPLESGNWTRDSSDKADYADTVLIARLHRHFLHGQPWSGPPLPELPAFRKLGLDRLGPAGSVMALLEAKEDVEAIAELLRG